MKNYKKTIREVRKGECAIMGDFNHGHIQWTSLVLEGAGGDDHQFLLVIQDSLFTQHVLEPTRGWNVLDLIVSSQNELVDNVKVHSEMLQMIQINTIYRMYTWHFLTLFVKCMFDSKFQKSGLVLYCTVFQIMLFLFVGLVIKES